MGDSGISYEAGDALNVMPVNDEELVRGILVRLNIEEGLIVDGEDSKY